MKIELTSQKGCENDELHFYFVFFVLKVNLLLSSKARWFDLLFEDGIYSEFKTNVFFVMIDLELCKFLLVLIGEWEIVCYIIRLQH